MGVFDRIFNKKAKQPTGNGSALISEQATFSTFNGDFYSNDIFRGAVDSIARHAGKLRGAHVISYDDHQKRQGDCKLCRLLSERPNPYMSAYDMLYKAVTRLYLFNNSYLLLDKDERGNVCGIYPITESSAEMLSDAANNLYARFTFPNGKSAIFPYCDIIHLRRAFCSDTLFGDDNGALFPAIQLAETQNDGIINGIKAGATLRGILSFSQIMNAETLKAEKKAFVDDYLSMSNDGGIVATDNKMTYTPLESKPVTLTADQMKAAQTKIYNYLGISEAIVNGSYTEDEYSAFFEGVIEPIAVALSLEFTAKIFNERERAFGNSIIFDTGRLAFTSNKTKIELIRELMPLGLLTVNQSLEILNLPPVKDGDRRLQSLNFVDQSLANSYQQGKAGNTDNGNNTSNT